MRATIRRGWHHDLHGDGRQHRRHIGRLAAADAVAVAAKPANRGTASARAPHRGREKNATVASQRNFWLLALATCLAAAAWIAQCPYHPSCAGAGDVSWLLCGPHSQGVFNRDLALAFGAGPETAVPCLSRQLLRTATAAFDAARLAPPQPRAGRYRTGDAVYKAAIACAQKPRFRREANLVRGLSAEPGRSRRPAARPRRC